MQKLIEMIDRNLKDNLLKDRNYVSAMVILNVIYGIYGINVLDNTISCIMNKMVSIIK